ncbi:xanthine dehydrogenase subunit D [Actinomadura sp. 3N508]|uniref:xanthine dehydrogenase subunit D n=1 Tax=Actinomadura sp. 3N508 TaxID=3375153 RepID=UPI0037B5D90A
MTIAPPPPATAATARGEVGDSARRPDGAAKVSGEFAYSSDLQAEGMLYGVTLRSPHPHARIRSIDVGPALRVAGVRAVLTHEDVPGANAYGLERADQPVLAAGVVRYRGEAVAVLAADRADTARYALGLIKVDYEPIEAVTDPERALAAGTPAVHEGGNLVRHLRLRHGPQDVAADVVVRGEYEVGMQDQAFLGPESALALPDDDGAGLELLCSTQWLHIDRRQLSHVLGLPEERIRLVLSGVGGAFGGREDLSVQAHAALLALRTGRPIKMSYGREESFFGHVHRHPARMRYEHGATRDGRLVYVRAEILLDGGAYASTSAAVLGNATYFAAGPYEVPSVTVDSDVVYTNNPPCGAMRGFGAVQVCFGYESQMDRLAAELGLHPVELRRRNALATGSTAATGQRVTGPAPVAELLRRVRDMPPPAATAADDPYALPGGVANATHGEGIRRGVGYAVSIKNVCKSAGYDDYSTARVTLSAPGGAVRARVHTAAAEVGQGLVTVLTQIARTELGVRTVDLHPADTSVGDAGTSSASRQTWMTGGAVKAACELVRAELLDRAATRSGLPPATLRAEGERVVTSDGQPVADLAELLGDGAIERTYEFHHRATEVPDPETGQGDAHVAYAFAAHRATVDVDVELGLVRVVEIATAEDVGKAMNPTAIIGQINGGVAQGLGLALMEEIQVEDGLIRNASFTDYLIPTIADMPPVRAEILETPHPDAPYGLTGVGEPPMISSPAAVAAAVRDATGLALPRIPVRPEHIAGDQR